MVNWAAIIVTIEVIGTVALIASFFYIAAQIRQNKFVPLATIVTATLLSPLLGVFLGTLFSGIFFAINESHFSIWLSNIADNFLSAAGMAIVSLVFSIPVVVLYGLPVAFLLRKFGIQNIWMYGSFGFIGGAAFNLILTVEKSARIDSSILDEISDAVGSGYGMFGLTTALAFWFIVEYIPLRKKRRQDCASDL